MARIKKAMSGYSTPMKAKSGKSFPDLNKDGKITKADILKGRGVIAKKGMKVKKSQLGTMQSSTSTKSLIDNAVKAMKPKSNPIGGDKKPASTNLYKKGGKIAKSIKSGGKMTKKCMTGCK